jgi:hypothetical protein
MDRRYSEMKLDGNRASDRSSKSSDALVAMHLQRAKAQNRAVNAANSKPERGRNFRAQSSDEGSVFGSVSPPRRNRPVIARPEL